MAEQTNRSSVNWTVIILAIFAIIGAWLLPSPLTPKPTTNVLTDTIWVPGITDTIYVPVPYQQDVKRGPAITGKDLPYVLYDGNAEPVRIGEVYQTETEHHFDAADIKVRSTYSPTKEKDPRDSTGWVLNFITEHEVGIQPKPATIIYRVDTLRVPYPIVTYKDVPFYEKPAFVIPTTVVSTLGIVYIISRILK